MKRTVPVVLALAVLAFACTDSQQMMPLSEVDVPPVYQEGPNALAGYLQENLVYPEGAQKAGTEGKVYVEFTVTEEGAVSEVVVKRGVSEALDAEALRVMQAMPNWQPAQEDGAPVAVKMMLPISFSLSTTASVDTEPAGSKFDTEPKYKGGTDALYAQLMENVVYPEEAKRMGTEGRVYVQFVVKKDGALAEAEVVQGVSSELDAEALQAVQTLSAWEPATKGGQPVAAKMVVPISFKL